MNKVRPRGETHQWKPIGTSSANRVEPLLLGGLLRFERGLLLRIGLGGDLLVQFGELRGQLHLEAGLTGVGLRVGLLPGGILDGLDCSWMAANA